MKKTTTTIPLLIRSGKVSRQFWADDPLAPSSGYARSNTASLGAQPLTAAPATRPNTARLLPSPSGYESQHHLPGNPLLHCWAIGQILPEKLPFTHHLWSTAGGLVSSVQSNKQRKLFCQPYDSVSPPVGGPPPGGTTTLTSAARNRMGRFTLSDEYGRSCPGSTTGPTTILNVLSSSYSTAFKIILITFVTGSTSTGSTASPHPLWPWL